MTENYEPSFKAFQKQFDLPLHTAIADNPYLRKLNNEECDVISEFMALFQAEFCNKKFIPTFRGDKKANYINKLFSYEPDNIDELYSRLFYFGDKAKHYLESASDVSSRTYLHHINDASPETFRFIFEQIGLIFCSGRYDQIINYDDNNAEFIDYFKADENIDIFISEAMKLTPRNRERVRDYYLYLLHTAQDLGVDKESIFVSTSKSYSEACSFAINGKNRSSIIISYFIPYPIYNFAVEHHSLLTCLQNTNLPRYDFELYPTEQEISVKGALFPHFIVGATDLEKDAFIVNPHLLSMVGHFDDISKEGVIVNQESFNRFFGSTGYKGLVVRHSSGIYGDERIESDKLV